jgi:hypothetical protein
MLTFQLNDLVVTAHLMFTYHFKRRRQFYAAKPEVRVCHLRKNYENKCEQDEQEFR